MHMYRFLKCNRIGLLALSSMVRSQEARAAHAGPVLSFCSWKRSWHYALNLSLSKIEAA